MVSSPPPPSSSPPSSSPPTSSLPPPLLLLSPYSSPPSPSSSSLLLSPLLLPSSSSPSPLSPILNLPVPTPLQDPPETWDHQEFPAFQASLARRDPMAPQAPLDPQETPVQVAPQDPRDREEDQARKGGGWEGQCVWVCMCCGLIQVHAFSGSFNCTLCSSITHTHAHTHTHTQEIKETRDTARSTPTNVPSAHPHPAVSKDPLAPQGLRVTLEPPEVRARKANQE